jgi:uncharacterized tellurite resistance protein B-like protein
MATARATVDERPPRRKHHPQYRTLPMSQLYQFLSSIQANGQISDDEVSHIREKLHQDGQLDVDDVKLLVTLYCETEHRCPAFDELFFSVLEKVLLADGQISPSEEFYLLKMLYSDRVIHEPEREFLRRLRKQLPERTASFDHLFDEAMEATAATVVLPASGPSRAKKR